MASSAPLRSRGVHQRGPAHSKPSHSFLSLALLVAFSLTLLIPHATTSPISSSNVAAIPDGPASSGSDGGQRKDSVEEAFRAQLTNDSSGKKVYIDTLTPEEVAIHRKTGRLPKRTMELIEQVLKAQEALKAASAASSSSADDSSNASSSSSSSSVEAADLYAELFPKGRKTT